VSSDGPRGRNKRSVLAKEERGAVLLLSDAYKEWDIYTDCRRLTGRLRKLAVAWGGRPERQGEGWTCRLPLGAVRFGRPRKPRVLSEAHREALKDARFGRDRHSRRTSLGGPR